MSNTFSNARDLTAQQRPAGGGMDHRRLMLCGHKSSLTGAQYKRGIGWLRCANCNAARKAAA